MTCRNAPPSALPRNLCAPFPYNSTRLNHDNPHHICIHTQQNHCKYPVDPLSILHSRIAALEEQLANVNAQKDSEDISIRYLLRLFSAESSIPCLDSISAEEVFKLRHKLLVSKLQQNQLRTELKKALLRCDQKEPPFHCCRTSLDALSNGRTTDLKLCSDADSTNQLVTTSLDLDIAPPVADLLIDLTDSELSTSAKGTPEFHHTDTCSSASDGSEESVTNILFTSQPIGGGKDGEFKSVEVYPEDSSYIRHFSSSSSAGNTAGGNRTDFEIGGAERCLHIGMPTHGSFDKLNRTPSTLSTVTEHSPGLTFLTGSESASTHTTIGRSTSPGFRMLDGSSTAEKAQLGKAALPGLAADKVRLGASHWNPRSLNRSRGTTAFEGSMWGVGKLFKSAQERQIAVSIHKNGIGPNELSFPDFFKYGISYNPDPSAGNVYRTIIISGLGSTVTMSALLEKVRGGVVVSAKLLDTTTITGSHTALITFLHEEPAVLLRDYAIRHPLTFKGHRAKVELLSRPTWPMAIPLRKAIEHGHTRCLTIRNFPHNISSERLRRDLCVCSVMTTDRIESMHRDTGGVLELRFESIWTAGKGYGVLTSRMAYRQCKVAFLPDPCAQPLAFPDEQTGPAFGISRLNGSETEDSQTLLGKGFSSTAGGFKGYSSGLLVPTLDVAQGKSALDIAKEHHLGDDGAQERLVINDRLSNAVILPDADVAAASVLDPTLSIISANGVKPAQSEGCSNGATSGRMDSLGHEVNVVAGA